VAVNIDGARTVDVGPREADDWIFDRRLAEEAQMGDWLYDDNDFDRGHLVRRLDPVWGDTPEEALRAEADTFHFTNCAPQHWRFNRLRDFWQGIEVYILDNVELHDLRVSLFTGPVLAPDDPPLERTQVPRDYWKVVAMRKRDGALAAAAYVLSQAELLRAPPRSSSSGSTRRSRSTCRASKNGPGSASVSWPSTTCSSVPGVLVGPRNSRSSGTSRWSSKSCGRSFVR
jgi:endonuclease G